MTHVTLLGFRIDSKPSDIHVDPQGPLLVRLAPGLHADVSDASPETLRAIAEAFQTAALIQDVKALPLPEVA